MSAVFRLAGQRRLGLDDVSYIAASEELSTPRTEPTLCTELDHAACALIRLPYYSPTKISETINLRYTGSSIRHPQYSHALFMAAEIILWKVVVERLLPAVQTIIRQEGADGTVAKAVQTLFANDKPDK